jgi:hypothetical protein
MKSTDCILIAAILSAPQQCFAAGWKVTIHAGAHDRTGSIVRSFAPPQLRGAALLDKGGGASVPVQIDEAGQAVFVAPALARGERKTFALNAVERLPAAIAVEESGDVLKLTAAGRPFFSYQMAPGLVPDGVNPIFRHGAHLHPVFTPGGKLVTGNHPADHRWHRGIWMAWTETEFEGRHPDFWNQGKGEGGEKAGAKLEAEVLFDSLDLSWSGPVHGGFVSRHRFIDHSGAASQDVLHETWDVAAYRVTVGERPLHLIDLVSTQVCARASPLKLPKYHYGGLGVRGHAQWDPVEAVTMLTSNGDDRKKGDSTKAKWVHLGGQVDGAPAGLAVLIHPANFRSPQALRLNPKHPQLCIAPSQDGDWEIAPGKSYVSRYRIVALDGPAAAALLDRLWADYAEPATAEIVAQ